MDHNAETDMEALADKCTDTVVAVMEDERPLTPQRAYQCILATLQNQDRAARERCAKAVAERAREVCLEA